MRGPSDLLLRLEPAVHQRAPSVRARHAPFRDSPCSVCGGKGRVLAWCAQSTKCCKDPCLVGAAKPLQRAGRVVRRSAGALLVQ